MNEQNLKPFNKRTESEQREIAHKGGIASGEARRERKKLTDVLRKVLNEASDDLKFETKLEEIVCKTLENLKKEPNIYELKTLQEMLGESVLRVDIDTTPPEEKLKKMMKDAGLC